MHQNSEVVVLCFAAPAPATWTDAFEPRSLTADINQYDISDPAHPRLTARLFTGGSIRAGRFAIPLPIEQVTQSDDSSKHPRKAIRPN